MSDAPEYQVTKTSIVLIHILYLIAGVFLSGGRYIFIMLGPAIGIATFVAIRPRPNEAIKQGAIGGAAAAIGMLLPLLSWLSPAYSPPSGSVLLLQLGWQVATALGTILLSALTAHILTRKPRPRDLEGLDYRSLVPSRGVIQVACNACGESLEIPTSRFLRSSSMDLTQSEEMDTPIPIMKSKQNYYDMSHLSSNTQTALGCLVYVLAILGGNAIVGLFGGGDMVVYVIGTLAFVGIAYALNKPLIRLMGGKLPIWVVSCPQCGAKIAIATNGRAFLAAVA